MKSVLAVHFVFGITGNAAAVIGPEAFCPVGRGLRFVELPMPRDRAASRIELEPAVVLPQERDMHIQIVAMLQLAWQIVFSACA